MSSLLPSPSVAAQIHSQRLKECIIERISQENWISFAEFMQMALYEPGLGYYVSGSRKLGAEGDFVTAPEISSAFSQCIALQCQQVLSEFSNGSILEFGAGSGVMAADILLALEKHQSLPEKYYILEVSPDLKERQLFLFQQQCSHLLPLIQWIAKIPENFEGIVLANEVLDAFPVHLFENKNGEVFEKGVAVVENEFVWQTKKNSGLDVGAIPCGCPLEFGQAQDLPLHDQYTSEICLAIKPWLELLYPSIKKGVVLLIDYGFPAREYYHPDRHMGTLMCHYRHHAHTNPFIYLGLQDITAHVDFSAVARAAKTIGFELSGYTNQANFLMALSILENTNLEILNTAEQYTHAQAIKKLLLPSEMGELFKVIALNKNIDLSLKGFQLKNELYRL